MSNLSLILYFVAICLMMGGIIYYIVVGSKGDLNAGKAITFIASFILAGLMVATIAHFVE